MFNAKIQRVIDKVDQLRHEVNDHWQIPADEAKLLANLVGLGRARSVLEIGVSYGFSTLHLAAAASANHGHVTAVDKAQKKVDAASANLKEAGLDKDVRLVLGDARQVIPQLKPMTPFDFVFIDAVKDQCFAYFEAVTPHLADHCALVTDNTGTHPDQLGAFVSHLRQMPGWSSCDVPVGNGFELTVRQPNESALDHK